MSEPPGSAKPFVHVNRRGVAYYLHEGKTSRGRPRYFFARTIGEGALSSIPAGHEVTESINGVVSLRRMSSEPSPVSEQDLAVVRRALSKHTRGAMYEARVDKGELIIYEAAGGGRFAPVMKFVPNDDGTFSAHRMTYRGDGGWSYPLRWGALEKLAGELVPHLGRDSFFEIY